MMVRALLCFLPFVGACTADTFVNGDASSTDAGSDAPTGPSCGPSQCGVGESCCAAQSNDGGTFQCMHLCPQQLGGNAAASLACTSAADCPNAVCCMHQSNGVTVSACESQCGTSEVQLCNPAAPDPGCPSNEPCSSSNIQDWKLPQSFGTCGGLGVP